MSPTSYQTAPPRGGPDTVANARRDRPRRGQVTRARVRWPDDVPTTRAPVAGLHWRGGAGTDRAPRTRAEPCRTVPHAGRRRAARRAVDVGRRPTGLPVRVGGELRARRR